MPTRCRSAREQAAASIEVAPRRGEHGPTVLGDVRDARHRVDLGSIRLPATRHRLQPGGLGGERSRARRRVQRSDLMGDVADVTFHRSASHDHP